MAEGQSGKKRQAINPLRYEAHKRLIEYIIRFHFIFAHDSPEKLSEAVNLDTRLVHKILDGYRSRQNLLKRLSVNRADPVPPCKVDGCKRRHLLHKVCKKCGRTFFKDDLCRKHYFNHQPSAKTRCKSSFGETPCPHYARSQRSGLCQTHYDRLLKGIELTQKHRSDKHSYCSIEVVSTEGLKECGLKVKENKGSLCIGHVRRKQRNQALYVPIGKYLRSKSKENTCKAIVFTNENFRYCGRPRIPHSSLCRGHRERRTNQQPMYLPIGERVPIYCAIVVQTEAGLEPCNRLVRETTRRSQAVQKICHGHLQRRQKGQRMDIQIGHMRQKPKRIA